MNVRLPKDDQRLPDNYGVKICMVTSEIREYELAQHMIIDKVYSARSENGKIVNDVVGCAPMPYLELWTKDDEIITIPLINIAALEFDKRYSKIVAIKNSMKQKAKRQDS